MNVSVTLDQKSLDNTLIALKTFGKDAEKVIKEVVNATAYDIETDAKMKIKADDHVVTSRLRSSIHAEREANKAFGYSDLLGNSFDGGLYENFGALEAIVGTNVEYGPKIEYEYDPFLSFAAEKNRNKFIQRMTDKLNALINKKG